MNLNLSEKVVLITGGTSGIGLAIAEAFGQEGAKIALCSSTKNKVDRAVESLKLQGIDVFGRVADVTSFESLSRFADEAEACFGGIDIWFNNAGIYPQYQIIETPLEVWDQTLATNLNSVFYGSLIARDKLQKRGGGVMMNASSFAATMSSVGSGVYAATKAAVSSMTKTLAAELAPLNIRVIGYTPGLIDTEMNRKLIEEKGEELVQAIALHRAGTAREVAEPLLFLASDKASYITGTFIEISGGKYAAQNPHQAWKK